MTLFPISLPDLSTPCAYAGVGSRESPPDVLDLMIRIAHALALRGFTMRSGAAPGADTAFEAGHRAAVGAERLEIYLPWAAFEREARAARGWTGGVVLQKATMRAEAVVGAFEPPASCCLLGWIEESNSTRLTVGNALLIVMA